MLCLYLLSNTDICQVQPILQLVMIMLMKFIYIKLDTLLSLKQASTKRV